MTEKITNSYLNEDNTITIETESGSLIFDRQELLTSLNKANTTKMVSSLHKSKMTGCCGPTAWKPEKDSISADLSLVPVAPQNFSILGVDKINLEYSQEFKNI